jgi:hypothetical protein
MNARSMIEPSWKSSSASDIIYASLSVGGG